VQRIVILGPGGAGKTTFARRIGELTGAPVVCLDAIWKPEGTDANLDEFRALVREAHAGERWVSDGNFAIATFDIRLPRATLIVWMEASKRTCAARAIRRVFRKGEPHRIGGLLKVFQFIWRFDTINRPRIEAARIAHGPHVEVLKLKSEAEIEAFLATIGSPLPL
jgi:adenylate kinase family enzyme